MVQLSSALGQTYREAGSRHDTVFFTAWVVWPDFGDVIEKAISRLDAMLTSG